MAVVTGPFWIVNLFFFTIAIGLGVAFILTSTSSHFYKWKMDTCYIEDEYESEEIFAYNIDLTVDIGWREFTATYVDEEAQLLCFDNSVQQGEVYSLNDFQDNSAAAAGLSMAAIWGVAVLLTMYTMLAMIIASGGKRKDGISLVTLMNLTVTITLAIITATTVFWWMLEGKFGNRSEALVPRLKELVVDAAEKCAEGSSLVAPCVSNDYDIITPGWSLALGIAAMFFYGFAASMFWMSANRVQSMNTRADDDAVEEVAKVPTGDFVVDKQATQSDEKVRPKDRRSAKTGVRATPSMNVDGTMVDPPDPMTYALEEGSAGDQDSALDDEDEVMYKNHQVHHNVINHSQANRTQEIVDSRRQQQYQRGYSHANSGTSFPSGMGGHSFEERSEGDFSDASSARYYGHNQGRSFMSNSSGRGESFDEPH